MTAVAEPEVDLPSRPVALGRHVDAPSPLRARPVRIATRAVAATIGVLGAWVLLYGFVLSNLQQHGTQARLYGRLRSDLAGATAPVAPPITRGTPVALLSVPRAGVHNVVVVEGTTSADLAAGPGHLPSTPLPGQAGISVLFGRSVTFGAPFRHLGTLRSGDPVSVTTQQGRFVFRVIDVRGPGAALPAAPKAGDAWLVLVTSAADGWRSGWAPQHVVYVDAALAEGTAQADPGGRPPILTAERPMRADTDVLLTLVLWLETLLAGAVAMAWSWVRWGKWQSWLIGVPLLSAVLWVVTDHAALLLPNLL